MRRDTIAENELYHLYSRGVAKQNLFLEEIDWVRFLFLIIYFQSPIKINNIPRIISSFMRSEKFTVNKSKIEDIIKNRFVELVSFSLMPNHFHMIVKNILENGISLYMHRVLTAYAKYFNEKYSKSGHVFQGPYGLVLIKDNRQLLHTSAYIHKNPVELPKWKNRIIEYPWSSYQDFILENRWGDLIKPDIILEQFKNPEQYKEFVTESTAKDFRKQEIII